MSTTPSQPWNPAVKDDNLRLTLARDEAAFIAGARRGAVGRVTGALVANLIIAGAGFAAVAHLDAGWSPLEGPWYSLSGFAVAACLATLAPAFISLVLGMARLVQARRYQDDLGSFLARYNRTLP